MSGTRREDDGVHRVVAASDDVDAGAVDGGDARVVVRERVRCEMRSERGMGQTGETVDGSVATREGTNNRKSLIIWAESNRSRRADGGGFGSSVSTEPTVSTQGPVSIDWWEMNFFAV